MRNDRNRAAGTAGWTLALPGWLVLTLAGAGPAGGQVVVDREARAVTIPAILQAEVFRASHPPDHRYHAVVHRDGSAAGQALFVTSAADTTVARTLRELGAMDGGGVPMSAWNLRWLPLIPQPDSRVQGTPVSVTVTWDGAPRAYAIHELLHDPGGEGVAMRFGGNEAHDHLWDSGCLLCLFSCPGGVISNAAYSIRDHRREATTFEPGDLLPPDGTPVTVVLSLAPE